MPFNLIKRYCDLLEIAHFQPHDRTKSLTGVFKQDIENNPSLKFRSKTIRPVQKVDPVADMDELFRHLTTQDDLDANGKKSGSRSFEIDRSQRLHWIKYHIEEKKTDNIEVFSCVDVTESSGEVIRTYIYDKDKEYIIILEPYRKPGDYYLITAYYLNKKQGKKQIASKMKKK